MIKIKFITKFTAEATGPGHLVFDYPHRFHRCRLRILIVSDHGSNVDGTGWPHLSLSARSCRREGTLHTYPAAGGNT